MSQSRRFSRLLFAVVFVSSSLWVREADAQAGGSRGQPKPDPAGTIDGSRTPELISAEVAFLMTVRGLCRTGKRHTAPSPTGRSPNECDRSDRRGRRRFQGNPGRSSGGNSEARRQRPNHSRSHSQPQAGQSCLGAIGRTEFTQTEEGSRSHGQPTCQTHTRGSAKSTRVLGTGQTPDQDLPQLLTIVWLFTTVTKDSHQQRIQERRT